MDGTTRVIDLTTGIAGAYCTKVLADGGAEVIKVEPPGGDPLRTRSASGSMVSVADGSPLFQYLSTSKRSVVVDPNKSADLLFAESLVRSGEVIVWSADAHYGAVPALHPARLHQMAPGATVVAISPFGLDSPWRDRPANQFTLQALSGGPWSRGSIERPPVTVGGEHGDWVVGTVATLALLASRWRTRTTGAGEIVDVAGLEALQLTQSIFPVTMLDLSRRAPRGRREAIPGIHRTKDGWVGLWVTTGQQWLDFCSMVERSDWYDNPELLSMDNRAWHRQEIVDHIDAWTGARTTEEIIELASLLRVPVAPVANGESLPLLDQALERRWFTENPRTGVTQPDVWYTMGGGAERRPIAPSPTLGQHTDALRAETSDVERAGDARGRHGDDRRSPAVPTHGMRVLPFEGLRIADFTAFWAGPIITHVYAMLGADVVHIESAKRPDGIRSAATIPLSREGWWETSPFFHGTNTNKRGLAVDLQTEAGRDIALRLVAQCDAVVENYSPRVMGQLGLGYDDLRAVKPDIIMLRAPAFGISGPWTDRVGYAPTIDQVSGMSWVTGYPDGAPGMPTAPADPVGGLHGAIALLLALEYRKRTGIGMLLESPQVGGGVNTTAEQVVEWSANRVLLGRVGNRSWVVAPQGIYRAADTSYDNPDTPVDDWVAISVEEDRQWQALSRLLDDGTLANDRMLDTVDGRKSRHEQIDAAISAWCADRRADDIATQLQAVGVPAERVLSPLQLASLEPIRCREFYEQVHHSFAGQMRIPGFPARFTNGPDRWHRSPAPRLGQNNRDLLVNLLGYSDDEVAALEADGVIGQRALKSTGW